MFLLCFLVALPIVSAFRSCPGTFAPHDSDCTKYYQCNFGQAVERSCAGGLHWNTRINNCDWPDNAQCATREIPIEENQVNVENDSCKEGDITPDYSDCSTYFICDHGKQVRMPCGQGLHFNARIKNCDWPESAKCTTGQPSSSTSMSTDGPTTTTTATTTTPKPLTQSTTTTPPPTTGSTSMPGPGGYKKICYFTDWAWYRPDGGKYYPKDIDPTLCTHIVYSFALLDYSTLTIKPADTWADIDNKFYEQVTSFKSKGTKVTIAVGGWNDSAGDKYSRMIADKSKRDAFIKSVQKLIADYNFDGLDLDWEYPVCWQGDCTRGPPEDKQNFMSLIKELRAAMPDKILSAAVSAGKSKIDAAYDVPGMSQYLDWIGVMDYDMRGSWDGRTGHHAPLFASPDDMDDTLNVDYSISYWIQKGADRKKLIVGMPLYGQSFTLANENNRGMNSASTGPGQAGDFTRQAGFLSYYEICSHPSWNVVNDPTGRRGPYAYNGNQWVSYDDAAMLRRKANYVKKEGLGGVMVWALDLDDFNNKCGTGRYPLLTAISSTLG